MMRRRAVRPMRPSLVGTVARTAVIAGTATAVSGKVAANQAAKAQAAAPPPVAEAPVAAPPVAEAPAAPAAGGLTDELIDQLKKLGELRDAGILTDEEFQAKKGQLLGI
jgi:hypothetical protein